LKLVGIKYCGGCNPKYDRAGFVQHLQEAFYQKEDFCHKDFKDQNGIRFEYAQAGVFYDVLIVVNGCERSCADTGTLSGNYFLNITSASELESAAGFLKNMTDIL